MDEQTIEVLKSVMETEVDGEAQLDEVFKADKVSKKGLEAIRGALRILNGFKEEMPKDVMSKLAGLAGYAPPGKDEYPKPKEDEMDKNKGKVNKADELPPEVKAILDPIMKAQNDQITALKEQIAKSDEALTKERDQHALEAWIKKCEQELSFYPGKSSEDLGKMLHVLAKQDGKLAEEQFNSMKQASATIEKSALLTDVGLKQGDTTRTGVTNGTAWDAICKLADGIVEKSEKNVSRHAAVSQVLKSEKGRQLYAQYLEEHPAQIESFRR